MKLKTFRELPNKKDIKDIVKYIRDYIFPDFFRESGNINNTKKKYIKTLSKNSF